MMAKQLISLIKQILMNAMLVLQHAAKIVQTLAALTSVRALLATNFIWTITAVLLMVNKLFQVSQNFIVLDRLMN